MASQKRVLVQFGDHNRSGHVPSAYKSSKTEFELLIERVRDVYSDLPPNCKIFLQVKDDGEELLWTTLKALSLTRIFLG